MNGASLHGEAKMCRKLTGEGRGMVKSQVDLASKSNQVDPDIPGCGRGFSLVEASVLECIFSLTIYPSHVVEVVYDWRRYAIALV